jgi:hypothetical protein
MVYSNGSGVKDAAACIFAVTGVPHAPQKLAVGGTGVPHFEQEVIAHIVPLVLAFGVLSTLGATSHI